MYIFSSSIEFIMQPSSTSGVFSALKVALMGKEEAGGKSNLTVTWEEER